MAEDSQSEIEKVAEALFGDFPVTQRDDPQENSRYLIFVWASPDSRPFRIYRLDVGDVLLIIQELVEEFGLDPKRVYKMLRKTIGGGE